MPIGIETMNRRFSEMEATLMGKTYGRWTIGKFLYKQDGKYGAKYFECFCACGRTEARNIKSILQGRSLSCGCYCGDSAKKRFTTHGKNSRNSKEYRAWANMKTRCYNQNRRSQHRYFGRGIKVCKRWVQSFENFFEDMGVCPDGKYSLDRKRNNGNYTKSNCRWATDLQQARNTSKCIKIKKNGQNKTLSEWAKDIGIPYETLRYRHLKGLSKSEVFFKGKLKTGKHELPTTK